MQLIIYAINLKPFFKDGFYILKIQVVFRIAIKAIPISPMTASNIGATPIIPGRMNVLFTVREKTIMLLESYSWYVEW